MFEVNKGGESSELPQGGMVGSLEEEGDPSIELRAKPCIFERLVSVLMNAKHGYKSS